MYDTKTYLTYKVGKETFATEVDSIKSVIEYSELSQAPELPSYVIGLLNYNGEALPVVDSRIKLGFKSSDENENTFIIVFDIINEGTTYKAGLLVDEVTEVVEIKNADIKPAPSIGKLYTTRYINGVYLSGESLIMLLDVKKLIENFDVFKTDQQIV